METQLSVLGRLKHDAAKYIYTYQLLTVDWHVSVWLHAVVHASGFAGMR